MNFAEIYEALRHVTYTKAQILQQVAHSKYTLEQLGWNGKNEERYCMSEDLAQKQQYTRLLEIKSKDSETKLIEGLNILKKEEREIRQLRNRRMQERMCLLKKRKQLEIQLEGLKFQSNQRNNQHNYRNKSLTQYPIKKKQEEAQNNTRPDFQHIEKEIVKKEIELGTIEKQFNQQKQNVNKIFSAYTKLEENIQIKRVEVNQLKKALQNCEFQSQKLKVQNKKLLKQALQLNQQQHSRNIENKIKNSDDCHQKLTSIYQAYIKGTEKYLQTVQKIKKQLPRQI